MRKLQVSNAHHGSTKTTEENTVFLCTDTIKCTLYTATASWCKSSLHKPPRHCHSDFHDSCFCLLAQAPQGKDTSVATPFCLSPFFLNGIGPPPFRTWINYHLSLQGEAITWKPTDELQKAQEPPVATKFRAAVHASQTGPILSDSQRGS